jgi:signal transduction histidine kinase
LSDAEGVLTLEISDNGQGISQQALDNPAAFGIRGLKERAKVVGGWLDISTRPGQGTTLILNIPLDEKTSSHDEADFL